MSTTPSIVQVNDRDDVAVLIHALPKGSLVSVGLHQVTLSEAIGAGHKVALHAIPAGAVVTKYGFPIGIATENISAGALVHSHNLRTALDGSVTYRYDPIVRTPRPVATLPTFLGFRRRDGRVGTRNEVWIINTVGCVNQIAERIAREANVRFAGQTDGIHAFSHPYGCSQLGDDLGNTQRILGGLARHPNAGGVLILGLGCENNQMASLLAMAERDSKIDASRLRYFNTQEVDDEIAQGIEAVGELVQRMSEDRREECPVSALLIGLKCGGSDGFSGITANPLVGRIADRITDLGGGALLTEVPEMFGAEQILINRAVDATVANAIGEMITDFKAYFTDHHLPVSENPSPGNNAGGITTLEEKSLGAIQKGGTATVQRVLHYGEIAPLAGLSLLESPGNDAVSSTAMIASGATVLLFTTGRGTPLGFPAPTIKISSNSDIATKKPHWIDFDAGLLLNGSATLDDLTDALFTQILDVASGRTLTNNERQGNREIAIWKAGVTL